MKMIPSIQPASSSLVLSKFKLTGIRKRLVLSKFKVFGIRNGDERSFSSFILPPFLMSAQEPVNVSILGMPQGFVSSAENDLTIAHHENLTINQTQSFTFFFEDHFAGFIDYSIFRSQVVEVVHFVRH